LSCFEVRLHASERSASRALVNYDTAEPLTIMSVAAHCVTAQSVRFQSIADVRRAKPGPIEVSGA
jgi:hypothetical protein